MIIIIVSKIIYNGLRSFTKLTSENSSFINLFQILFISHVLFFTINTKQSLYLIYSNYKVIFDSK